MSQSSEKIPKEKSSLQSKALHTVSSTRYFFGSFKIQINNFRKSSKKFLVDLLTRNVALNLSGALFFIGLSYSLKWWYKDQLFVILLKQNLPALSEFQQDVFWETDESMLDGEHQTWTPLIDRIDLYANHVRVKFKQPWQKNVYERFIGVFGEPSQTNGCKHVLTTKDWKEISVTDHSLSNELQKSTINITPFRSAHFSTYTPENAIFPKRLFKLSPRNLCFLNQRFIVPDMSCQAEGGKKRGGTSAISNSSINEAPASKTRHVPQPAQSCEATEGIKLPCALLPKDSWQAVGVKALDSFHPSSEACEAITSASLPAHALLYDKICSACRAEQALQALPLSNSWGSEAKGLLCIRNVRKINFTEKLSYPLQFTKEVAGWQPSPNLLILNSYFDEIPYKLENVLQSYFPKKDSQLLFLSTSFRKSIEDLTTILLTTQPISETACSGKQALNEDQKNLDLFNETTHSSASYARQAVESSSLLRVHLVASETRHGDLLPTKIIEHKSDAPLLPSRVSEQTETYFKKAHLFETKKLLQNQFASLINSFPINFVEKLEAIVEKERHSHTVSRASHETSCLAEHVVEKNRLKGSNVSATSALYEKGNESNLFENNDHDLVKVTKKLLAVKTNTQKGVLLPLIAHYPEGLAKQQLGNTVHLGGEVEFQNLPVAADAVKIEGLDPLLLLNTLGFTFNNFSPLTNPPILLANEKLGVGVTNIFNKPKGSVIPYLSSFARIFISPLLAHSGEATERLALRSWQQSLYPPGVTSSICYSETPCLAEQDVSCEALQEASNPPCCASDASPDPGGVKESRQDASCKALRLSQRSEQAKFVSFYFNPKNLNWVVSQQSPNGKFNSLLKKVVNETNQPMTTQSTHLIFEFLKGESIKMQGAKLSFLNKLLTISNVNKIAFKPKKTKLETQALCYHTNVVDKNINFDKKLRYMSGYVYPDMQSNSLKTHLYQWLGITSSICCRASHETPCFQLRKPFTPPGSGLASKGQLAQQEATLNIACSSLHSFHPQSASCTVAAASGDTYSRASHETSELKDRRFAVPATQAQRACEAGVKKGEVSKLSVPCFQRTAGKEEVMRVNKQIEDLQCLLLTPLASCARHVSASTKDSKGIAELRVLTEKSNSRSSRFTNRMVEILDKASLSGREILIKGIIPTTFASLYTPEKKQLLENNQYSQHIKNVNNIEVPYKKFNHYLAKYPGFSDPSQFFTTLPPISCGNENLVNESCLASLVAKRLKVHLVASEARHEALQGKTFRAKLYSEALLPDKSEINKLFIQKNGCNPRKVAYSGIVVQRNKWTKDFQPFKESKELLDGASKSSIWGTLFLGPENPLTDRQCHFFGQKQLSTLDTNSLQRDYLRQLGKEILMQANSKGYTEFSSIERTKILSLSKKVNSFFFKKRKYSYLLEPKDQWHLLFQEQLCTALEDYKKYSSSTSFANRSFEEINSEKFKESFGSGRIKISAPLVMARFPKTIHNKFPRNQLEQGISWRPFCHLQGSSLLKLSSDESLALQGKTFTLPLSTQFSCFASPVVRSKSSDTCLAQLTKRFILVEKQMLPLSKAPATNAPQLATQGITSSICQLSFGSKAPPLNLSANLTTFNETSELQVEKTTGEATRCIVPMVSMSPYLSYPQLGKLYKIIEGNNFIDHNPVLISHYPLFTERFSEKLNAIPYLNKNSFFYLPLHSYRSETAASSANQRGGCEIKGLPCVAGKGVTSSMLYSPSSAKQDVSYKALQTGKELKEVTSSMLHMPCVAGKEARKGLKSMKNNLLGIQKMCTSLLIQEPLNCNSWAVLNQWVFLIALLLWIEQTLLDNVFPALFALEQILLSAAGVKTGGNNRTDGLRISKNETPKFQNLAGVDGLLGELSELVLFLRGQRNLGFWKKWNKKNSYGVLLTGSPGTGKTFLVRALANEAKVPVLILSASTLTASKLNNNKPSWSIRHAFKRAKQLAPCILFIDEIDALGKSRGKIVTDINEIVADSVASDLTSLNASFLNHKRMLTKSTSISHTLASPIGTTLGNMFSYEQFGQNCSNFTATLLHKWEYPLQSTILQESNEINQNSLCQEKLVDLLKIAGPGAKLSGVQDSNGKGSDLIESSRFKKESTTGAAEQLPTREKEMTRGKFGPLTQLLVSMDGVSSFSGVLIMGATNRPELLDPALTRPGRFEKKISIDKPSEQNRIEILQLYSQNLGVQQQIPWSYLATRTIGLTTADLAVAMNYSSLRAIIQGSVHTLETIEYGLNCITRL